MLLNYLFRLTIFKKLNGYQITFKCIYYLYLVNESWLGLSLSNRKTIKCLTDVKNAPDLYSTHFLRKIHFTCSNSKTKYTSQNLIVKLRPNFDFRTKLTCSHPSRISKIQKIEFPPNFDGVRYVVIQLVNSEHILKISQFLIS